MNGVKSNIHHYRHHKQIFHNHTTTCFTPTSSRSGNNSRNASLCQRQLHHSIARLCCSISLRSEKVVSNHRPLISRAHYCGGITIKPYWEKSRSKVKARGRLKRSITAKLMASAKEKSLSVY